MDNKEIKINVPEGYEIDKENSTFECIKFKKKGLTYKDVCHALFHGKSVYFIGGGGEIRRSGVMGDGSCELDANNASSIRQLEQLLALNKLMNVAAYLNEQPLDWNNNSQGKWYIYYYHPNNDFKVAAHYNCRIASIYFDSEEHAKRAIGILGEDVVKLALGVFD